MDDPLLGLAAVLAAGGNDLLTGLQLSEAQRSLGLSPHLVFLAGVALALPAQVDGGTAAFSAEQERTFARLQISYDQACQRIGAPPHPTRLYKLSPLLVPAQPLSITELLRVSTTPADSTASSEEGTYPAGPAPTASEAALAAASATAAAAATQLLAEERRAGAATSVSCQGQQEQGAREGSEAGEGAPGRPAGQRAGAAEHQRSHPRGARGSTAVPDRCGGIRRRRVDRGLGTAPACAAGEASDASPSPAARCASLAPCRRYTCLRDRCSLAHRADHRSRCGKGAELCRT